MPLVSVIIPTYNRSNFLRMSISSVLKQSFRDFELIVVDDCSPDDTPQVINSINSHKVNYIRHNANKGESESRNTGIKIAESKYIAFLDDDDEWLSDKLSKQIEIIEQQNDDVGAVYGGFLSREAK